MTTGPIVPPTPLTWCSRCRRYCAGTAGTHEIMAHAPPIGNKRGYALRKGVLT